MKITSKQKRFEDLKYIYILFVSRNHLDYSNSG